MSGRSSPVNGGYEAASSEPAMRLTVRKDLFPEVCLPKLEPLVPDSDDPEGVSCVKLETDFEQSIDEIANRKQLVANGALPSPKPRHRKHKQHSRREAEQSALNGCRSPEIKRKKKSRHKSPLKDNSVRLHVKGGKNLNLVSSSECQDDEEEEMKEAESESSDDEVLKYSVQLPFIPRQSGKPYSHELSQLSTKKSKSKDSTKERRTYTVVPCSGKPRSMLDICSSRSKKKSKKTETLPTYHSQIVDTNTIKIKIRKTNYNEAPIPVPAAPSISIADLGQRKSKKKRAASPVSNESSGEEYFPVKDKSVMSVAAPKVRNQRPKANKTKTKTKVQRSKNKVKSEKTERNRDNTDVSDNSRPQSPWAQLPEEILIKIFEYAVASQGALPTVVRLGRVCKLWHSVSCRPELWKHMDLSQYTVDKCKTDYKLVWLLENRLSQCQSLNIANWKESNISWVLACVVDYCPNLVELNLGGWCRTTAEQLLELVTNLKHLRRLDLSHTSETGGSGSCLSAASMARLAETLGERLTHLTLANNKFTALPQILSSIATHCRQLQVLDISGACASSHPALVPLEALQRGCPALRVFRAANSQLVLAPQPAHSTECSGWTRLEELSIAGEAAAEKVGVGEYRFGDEALARLVRGATGLTLLDLRGLQRLTDSGLVRVPAWDLQQLFLAGCQVTRQRNACLELICEKWSHSLIELDLSWASASRVLDDAVRTLADSPNSKLRILNLCGSSVSLEPVKKVLLKCSLLESLNLSSCRALPRGMKRLYTGKELQDLKDSFDPTKAKPKEDSDEEEEKKTKGKKKTDDKKSETKTKSPQAYMSESSSSKTDTTSQDKSSSTVFQQPKSVSSVMSDSDKQSDITKSSPDSKSHGLTPGRDGIETTATAFDGKRSMRDITPKLLSPMAQSKPDSSSTPRSEPSKAELGSPHFSPVAKPDSQVQTSPEVQPDILKTSSWNLGHFKTTPTHKSEASPLNRLEGHNKLKHGKLIEQYSPTTSLENKQSPETLGVKDIKNPNNWNYGNYSQRSPYSAQPSPAQPSPYSTQPSPYSTQPSPYSSQPSPYSTQPSPDTSQIVKPDLQKSNAWNSGNYSPMPKQNPFSPHPSTHASPDPSSGLKTESLRSNPNKTPGQYSPMSRQDRLHQSPYSPRPSVEHPAYTNKPATSALPAYSRPPSKLPEPGAADAHWPGGASLESIMGWAASTFTLEQLASVEAPAGLSTAPAQAWGALPSFESSVARRSADPWNVSQFHVEPPHELHDTFVEQSVSFDSLAAHAHHTHHAHHAHHAHHTHHTHHTLQPYLEEFPATETSRVD